MNKLVILTTGGTIDKVYFDAASAFQVGAPVIEALLDKMNVDFDVSLNQLMRVDSLDMTDRHRELIHRAVEESDAEYILITHGTDGMVETANGLKNVGEKKIIFTGALQPAAFAENDAVFKPIPKRPRSSFLLCSKGFFEPNDIAFRSSARDIPCPLSEIDT